MAALTEEKNASEWKRMARCPVKLFANPIVLSKNEIILSPYGKNEYLRRYDIERNEFTQYIPYPTEINIKFHTIACDHENGKIYLYDGCNKIFIQFDISKQLVTKCLKKKQSIVGNGKFSSSIIYKGKFHVIGGTEKDRHLVWNTLKQKFDEYCIAEPTPAGHRCILLRRNDVAPQIVLFGGNENVKFKKYLDTIYIGDIHPEIGWKKLTEHKMPYKQYFFGCISYKEQYVIIFGGKQKDPNLKKINDGLSDQIWVLSLTNWKWNRSHLKCPKKAKYYAVKTEQDIVHLFEYEGDGSHWSIPISMLISHTVIRRESLEQQLEKLGDKLTEINEENDDLLDAQKDYKQKMKTLKHKNKELKVENDALKEEIARLKKQDVNRNIQQSLAKAKKDYKILSTKYKQLQNKTETKNKINNNDMMNPFEVNTNEQNKNGNVAKNPFEDDYTFWGCNDIIQWIAKLHSGKYRKYLKVVQTRLQQRNVDGHSFVNYQLNDLKNIGVTNYNDAVSLLQQIKVLKNANNDAFNTENTKSGNNNELAFMDSFFN